LGSASQSLLAGLASCGLTRMNKLLFLHDPEQSFQYIILLQKIDPFIILSTSFSPSKIVVYFLQ
jgi:hypothetical protein